MSSPSSPRCSSSLASAGSLITGAVCLNTLPPRSSTKWLCVATKAKAIDERRAELARRRAPATPTRCSPLDLQWSVAEASRASTELFGYGHRHALEEVRRARAARSRCVVRQQRARLVSQLPVANVIADHQRPDVTRDQSLRAARSDRSRDTSSSPVTRRDADRSRRSRRACTASSPRIVPSVQLAPPPPMLHGCVRERARGRRRRR